MTGDHPETWPDGTPVTPWADPWHDIAADIRAAKRSAFNDSPYAPADDDDDPCAAWKRSGSCGIDCPCITQEDQP